ncbi:MAG TPA: efflux RND transporter periplasmic adaptor subunit [Lentisphaeria bacterium]|nr:efflux RND transporter periplasmic adaptor subunit [Lentisphaeria bacterium]
MDSPVIRKRTVFGIKLFIFLIIAGSVFYWFRFSPVKVQAYKITRGTVVNEVMGTGTLEARVRSSISPEISGLLVEVLVDQNDRVTKGQLLANLDDGDFLQQVEMAKAELAAAKASIALAEAEITRTQATVVQARSSFERVSSLRKSQALSQSELDKALESKDVAESNLNRANLAKAHSELLEAKAEASLRYYQERLADTKLYASFDGLVVRRNREPGDVVVPGSSILDIISTEQLWISAWVDETAMGLLALEQPARIVFRSSPETPLKGRVMRIAPRTDSETREFLVDVGVDQLPKIWAVGQRAEVYIEAARKIGVVLIPQKFIVWRDGQSHVMIDDAGKARWLKISLGLKGRENAEITDGLSEWQIVIGALPGSDLPAEGRTVKHDKL